ncbi:Kynurenine 3-monooxygenase [Portunus trituberculatus]|uniref:Kynurenine 3-monooxygenase n=1 Tax=Portunus trituberculatus TaxID=210409 RepID=A0A5B7GYB4_PORTR|nr:Kynurenine 3-monooxygenase [Portunus trituberculatus]
MKARMIHSLDGTTRTIPYNRENKVYQCFECNVDRVESERKKKVLSTCIAVKDLPNHHHHHHHQCIFSVGRRFVNEVLLTRAEDFPNVTVHFNHKLETCDLERGELTFTE